MFQQHLRENLQGVSSFATTFNTTNDPLIVHGFMHMLHGTCGGTGR